MHAVGLHSALAIKRQRKRRDEQRKAKERRYSTQSVESGLGSRSSFASPRNSIGSMDGIRPGHAASKGFRMGVTRRNGRIGNVTGVSSAGMLHIGVVFLVLGLFLVVSALLPSGSAKSPTPGPAGTGLPQWAELLIAGIFFLVIGAVLVIINRVMATQEDARLTEYVKSQLTRSKSGHRLVRDLETGNLSAPARKSKSFQHSPAATTPSEVGENGSVMIDGYPGDLITPVHIPISKIEPHSPLTICLESEMSLEKIEEEDGEASMAAVVMAAVVAEKGEAELRAMDAFNKETQSEDSYAVSLSPGTPSETKELLTGRTVRISRI
ncbi:hypothetical protein J437_LFUL007764 [Ladona fulva]|uniref:Uncharacterized protein n=1 Tax=Ladona fulva TaxID=123851 RepID=A0A8K0P0C1_LADFU|nr:hypothetical protein J437_LFUL007764 [Ladona fulva]